MIRVDTPIDQLRGCSVLVTTAPFFENHLAGTVDLAGDELMGELGIVLDEDQPMNPNALAVWVLAEKQARWLDRQCLTVVGAHPVRQPVEIPPDVAAHVLYPYAGIGYRAGSFTSALIEALALADPENMARLRLSFPEYAEAVHLAKNVMGGIEVLKRHMRAAG